MTAEQMIERAERLERFAAAARREGATHGPEGAEDAEMAAAEWREAASQRRAEDADFERALGEGRR